MDILVRGLQLFDQVILACGDNPRKRYLFALHERLALLRACTADLPEVRVDAFEGLLVDYCRRVGARAILRGLRAVSDFDFEFQTGLANMDMAPEIQTVFLLTEPGNVFVSSSLIKEIAANGGSVDRYVPAPVARALRERLGGPR